MPDEPVTHADLIDQLVHARREADYYKHLAIECSERRLKEIEDLSHLVARLRQSEIDLAHSYDKLEERVQQHMAELQATTTRLDLLRIAMNKMTAVLDTTRLFHIILEQAMLLASATCGQLLLYDQQSQQLHRTLSLNLTQKQVCDCPALEVDILSLIAHRSHPLILNEYVSWPDHAHTCRADILPAIMLIPLVVGNECMGAISIGKQRPNQPFTPTDEQILYLFAQQATIALRNAHLFTEIQKLATLDPQTGLYNRRLFFELAEKEIERALFAGDPISIIMVDIDSFKRINDTYGHLIGDEVLRVVTSHCRSTMRSHDISGRYGGEEIAVLLPRTDTEDAEELAERLRSMIAQTVIACERGYFSVTVSLGVATRYASHGLKLKHLIRQVDQALYQAKVSGRNRVCVWNEVLAQGW